MGEKNNILTILFFFLVAPFYYKLIERSLHFIGARRQTIGKEISQLAVLIGHYIEVIIKNKQEIEFHRIPQIIAIATLAVALAGMSYTPYQYQITQQQFKVE